MPALVALASASNARHGEYRTKTGEDFESRVRFEGSGVPALLALASASNARERFRYSIASGERRPKTDALFQRNIQTIIVKQYSCSHELFLRL